MNRYIVTTDLRFNDLSVHPSTAAKRFGAGAIAWRRRLSRASSFLSAAIFATTLEAADNISVLGNKPRWNLLEHYQQTITRDEFAHLVNDVYGTHGFAPDLIEINEDAARILINRDAQKFFTLRFAASKEEQKNVPRLWRPAESLPPARPDKPLGGLRIALDPGHLGGSWAKMVKPSFVLLIHGDFRNNSPSH